MNRSSEFRALVSGERRGAAASLLRGVLRGAEVPYSLAVQWRNRRYNQGRAAVVSCGVPVVSVGNLTLGGTGKTPMVKWLARWAGRRGVRAAVVSRGYGARAGGLNDEGRELAEALPDVPHVQNPDRVSAARRAVGDFAAELILLDDGFQHRRLARNLDIVLLDALQPFGFDHVFPRGLLREPAAGLARADVVCLSRADLVPPAERAAVHTRVAQLAPRAAWCEVVHAASGLVNSVGQSTPLDALQGKRVLAFCGLGNPTGFRRTLEATGCPIVAWHEFPDHHAFTAAELEKLTRAANDAEAELLVCTHKDLVKVGRQQLGDRPLRAVTVEIEFQAGGQEMENALQRAIQRR